MKITLVVWAIAVESCLGTVCEPITWEYGFFADRNQCETTASIIAARENEILKLKGEDAYTDPFIIAGCREDTIELELPPNG